MRQKTFSLIAGVVFALVAILHLKRLIFGWEAIIGNWQVPMWFSWFGMIGAGFLAFWGFRLSRK